MAGSKIVDVLAVSVLVVGCTSPELPGAETTTETSSGSSSEDDAPEPNDAEADTTETGDETETSDETGTNLDECTRLDFEVIEHNLLTTWNCHSSYDEPLVFQSKPEVQNWIDMACPDDGLGCDGKPCDAPPNVSWFESTVLVAVGFAAGGSDGVFVWDIYDCGDHVEAHYLFDVYGNELAFISANEAVRIDKIDLPVEFYGDSNWTPVREPP